MAASLPEERREMLERESRPTATTVSRTISDSVTMSAKPRDGGFKGGANRPFHGPDPAGREVEEGFMGFS
jgi:hypothetical protein